jgi:hypothetical protein
VLSGADDDVLLRLVREHADDRITDDFIREHLRSYARDAA